MLDSETSKKTCQHLVGAVVQILEERESRSSKVSTTSDKRGFFGFWEKGGGGEREGN